MKAEMKHSQAGVVLIAVLWGVLLMAAIAFTLATSVRVGVDEVHNRKESLQAYYLARGAVYQAALTMTASQTAKANSGYQQGQRSIEWTSGPNRITVELCDEAGKIDLNKASDTVLLRLFMALGLEFTDARALTDAVEDWRDPDSETRPLGAEDSYYLTLPQPYRAANADFRSVEELLLVRGVTQDLYYGRYIVHDDGTVERLPGLEDCLTVFGTGQAVNINYAPYPVLMALPGMQAQVANYIIAGRQQKPFVAVSDITREFPVSLGAESISSMSAQTSINVSLVARATAVDGISARVRAVVQFKASDAGPFRILTWDDSYVH
jgi:general secretion pathway protein K